MPDLTAPNLAPPGGEAPTFFGAYGEWMQTPLPTWEDMAWLREQWDGPFMLKGVTGSTTPGARSSRSHRDLGLQPRRQQPRRHAGPDPGSSPRWPRPSAARSRSCSTVASAAAATSSRPRPRRRAVMIGRAYLWGLAADGQAGVENVLDILRGGIDSRCSVSAIPPSTT